MTTYKKNKKDDEPIVLNEQQMSTDADWNTRIRDSIVNLGSDYGITNDDIGWYSTGEGKNGMVTIKGMDFMTPDKLENGRSWTSQDNFMTNWNNFLKAGNYQKMTDLGNYGYNDYFSSKMQELYDQIMNTPDFSYDPDSDQSFQAMKGIYNKQGERSLADTMSEASSLTGGRLNSWAVSAGNQAKQNWDDKLMGLLPQYEQNAYNRYKDDRLADLDAFDMLQSMDNEAYRRALDQYDMKYQLGRDATSDAQFRESMDFELNQAKQDQANWDKNFEYGIERDRISDEQWQKNYDINYYNSRKYSGGSSGSESTIDPRFQGVYKILVGAEDMFAAIEENKGSWDYEQYQWAMDFANGHIDEDAPDPDEERRLLQDEVDKGLEAMFYQLLSAAGKNESGTSNPEIEAFFTEYGGDMSPSVLAKLRQAYYTILTD